MEVKISYDLTENKIFKKIKYTMSKSRKKKNNIIRQKKLTPSNYIRKVGRKLAIHECLINEDWMGSGLATILVARKRGPEKIAICIYLVDTFMMGLKNTNWKTDIPNYEYDDFTKQVFQYQSAPSVQIEPMIAYNIIYGAIEYAEDLGFGPHKDFNISEYFLDDVESIEYIDIPFGKDGKPFFISGPNDNADLIIKKLTARGLKAKEDFDYLVNI